jgi:dCMP deaminase
MEETLLEVAATMARRGTCSRARVGAVVARDGRILTSGYNGAPRGLPHCLHPLGEISSTEDVNAPTCTVAVHAEANAVAFAARHGIALDRSTLFTTLSPCVVCAQLVVNAGITAVYVGERYRDLTGVRLLNEAHVVVFSRMRHESYPGLGWRSTWQRDDGSEDFDET